MHFQQRKFVLRNTLFQILVTENFHLKAGVLITITSLRKSSCANFCGRHFLTRCILFIVRLALSVNTSVFVEINHIHLYCNLIDTTLCKTIVQNMEGFKYLIVLILCAVNVNSMALKGPPLTRYDPCGLGVIHFDRLMKNYWQGVLHLGLYKSLIEVEIEIHFEKTVRIYGVSLFLT